MNDYLVTYIETNVLDSNDELVIQRFHDNIIEWKHCMNDYLVTYIETNVLDSNDELVIQLFQILKFFQRQLYNIYITIFGPL